MEKLDLEERERWVGTDLVSSVIDGRTKSSGFFLFASESEGTVSSVCRPERGEASPKGTNPKLLHLLEDHPTSVRQQKALKQYDTRVRTF